MNLRQELREKIYSKIFRTANMRILEITQSWTFEQKELTIFVDVTKNRNRNLLQGMLQNYKE
jgi:hypothetical protein